MIRKRRENEYKVPNSQSTNEQLNVPLEPNKSKYLTMSYSDVLIVLVLLVIVTCYLFLKKKFSYFEDLGIPHLKPPSWIMGNVGGVGKTQHLIDLIRDVFEAGKGKDVIAGFYTMFEPSILITDLEFLKHVTVKDFNSFADRGLYVNEENEPITGHLFSLAGDRWRFLRNKLSPTFTSGKIKMMYHTISDKGQT